MYRWASRRSTGGNTFDGLPQAWQDQMTAHGASTVREMDQMLRPYPSRAAIRSITCPVTVIKGSLSDPVFAEAAAFVARLLPQSRLITLPGAAHFLHIDQPARSSRPWWAPPLDPMVWMGVARAAKLRDSNPCSRPGR